MNREIYAPPESMAREQVKSSTPVYIYSPKQVACGTIGGPIGLIYFLMSNFGVLGQNERKKKTLVLGAAFMVVLIVISLFIPKDFSGIPFTVLYIVVAYQTAERYQLSKQTILESEVYKFHSNWRVLGIGLLCFVGSAVAIIGPMLGLYFAGLWVPA